MSGDNSGLYDFLRYAWYLLIVALFFLIDQFYQFYYQTTKRLIYVDVIKHYANLSPSEYPLHFVVSALALMTGFVLVVLINPFQSLYEKNRVHGSARFAKLPDIKRLGLLKAKGSVLCKWRDKTLYLSEPLSILLLAPPGTYKTTGVAIPTLFMNPNSIIALDVKKELFEITSKHRSTFSHVMIFEPTSATTSCWNPLDKAILPSSFAERYVSVQNIAANIFVKSESTSDPYWIDSARELFINIAIALIHRDDGTSIPAVYEASLGDGETARKDSIADLGDLEGLYEPIAKRLSAYRYTADQQFSGTLGTFDTGLMGFQDPRVKAAVSRCDIAFDQLRGFASPDGEFKPVTLYLVIRPVDVERLSPLIRVFFETLSKYLLSTSWDKKKEFMITFLLDEFPRLGKMEDIIKMPALSRGQGVNSILIAQDAGQIERVYQKSGREEIMSTTAYKIIPSQNSFESAKIISDTVGDETIKTSSSSKSMTSFFQGSTSLREQGKKLLTPQKIMSLRPGKCFVISQFAAETPIKGKLAIWFKDRHMRKLAGEISEEAIYRPNATMASSVGALQASGGGESLPSREVIETYYALSEEELERLFPYPNESESDDTDSALVDNPSRDEPDQPTVVDEDTDVLPTVSLNSSQSLMNHDSGDAREQRQRAPSRKRLTADDSPASGDASSDPDATSSLLRKPLITVSAPTSDMSISEDGVSISDAVASDNDSSADDEAGYRDTLDELARLHLDNF